MSMKPSITGVNPQQGEGEWSSKFLGNQEFSRRTGLMAWWNRLTAPPEPPPDASLAQRELARRGRLASTIVFFLIIVLFLALPIGIFGSNHAIAFLVSALLIAIMISLLFNRAGKSNITGLIVSVAINIGLIMAIRTSPGGLSASVLGLFDILVFVEIFVASLLPVNWVLGAYLFNVAFIVFDITTQQRTASFAITMSTDFYTILVRPIILHTVVSAVLWLWVRSATQAIARADRAEVIAKLEHAIAEQEHATAEEKRQLDVSVQEIVQTHIRVSNGDFDARVPLREGTTLWTVAVSLNNLLSRFQRLRYAEQEIQKLLPRVRRASQIEHEYLRTKNEVAQTLQVIRESGQKKQSMQFMSSGTMLDPLAAELHGKYLIQKFENTDNTFFDE